MKGIMELIPGLNEQFYYINGEAIESEVEYIKERGIKNVGLNAYKGYNLNDIKLLSKVAIVEKLSLEITDIDIKGIENMRKLQYLYFRDDNHQKIDFKNLPNLKYLNIKLHEKIFNLKSCQKLEELYVSDFDSRVFEKDFFSILKDLKSLTFNNVKKLVDLKYFELPSHLEELNLFHCVKLEDIDSVEELAGTMKFMEINSCKKIKSLGVLAKMKNLEKLIIYNSIPISSASMFDSLKKLVHLTVTGSSFFIDGDLSSLSRIAQSGHIGIDNKKYYSHTFEDFKKSR